MCKWCLIVYVMFLSSSFFFVLLSRLTAPFALIPQSIAPLPSPLRRLAYSEGSATLVGPDGDPDGWSVLSNVNVKGMLFDTKVVDVECSVSGGVCTFLYKAILM